MLFSAPAKKQIFENVDRYQNGIYICGSLNPKVMTVKGMNDLDHTLYTDYPEFEFEYANIKEPNTLPPEKQTLIVGLDKRKMDGAPITYITGFVGRRIDLKKDRRGTAGCLSYLWLFENVRYCIKRRCP